MLYSIFICVKNEPGVLLSFMNVLYKAVLHYSSGTLEALHDVEALSRDVLAPPVSAF